MKPRHARSRPFPRAPGPVGGVPPLLVALCLLLVGGSSSAQEIERLAPAESPGPALDLWIESSHPDLDFGYWVSEPSYVAVFEVIPGLGATLVLPDRDGPRGPVEIGRRAAGGSHYASLARDARGWRQALDRGWASHAPGYGVRRPDRGYLLLVAARAPLHLWAFTRLDDYRHAASGRGERTPYGAAIRTAAQRLIELVVASPEAGGWSAAYLPYSLRLGEDRFALGRSIHSASLCAYGFPAYGFPPFGSYGYGGYGIGLRSGRFLGHRGLGRAPYGSGIGLRSDPFGFGHPFGFAYPTGFGHPFGLGFPFGFASPYGSRSHCGYGAPTPYRLGLLRFRDPFFPPRPIGPPLPPVSDGGRTAAIPPPSVYRKTPTPTLERPELDAAETGAAHALERTLVPVRPPTGRLALPAGGPTPARGAPGEIEPGPRQPRVRPTEPERGRIPGVVSRPATREPSRRQPEAREPSARPGLERPLSPSALRTSPRALRPGDWQDGRGARQRPRTAERRTWIRAPAGDPTIRSRRLRSPGIHRFRGAFRAPRSFRTPDRIRIPASPRPPPRDPGNGR